MTKVFEDLLENEDFSLYFLINLSNQKKTIVKWGVLARPGKSFFLPLFLTNWLLNTDAFNNGGQSTSKTKEKMLQMNKLMVELVRMKMDANQASNGGTLS